MTNHAPGESVTPGNAIQATQAQEIQKEETHRAQEQAEKAIDAAIGKEVRQGGGQEVQMVAEKPIEAPLMGR